MCVLLRVLVVLVPADDDAKGVGVRAEGERMNGGRASILLDNTITLN